MATYNGHNEDASGNILLSIGNGMAATLETGTKASQAYTKGAYLYYNNRLCKVTAAIAKNATLTIGTNIAYTTLGAELTSHLRASNGNELYFDYKDNKPGYYPTSAKTASTFVPFGGSSNYTEGYIFYDSFNSGNMTVAGHKGKAFFATSYSGELKQNNTSLTKTTYSATYNNGHNNNPSAGATALDLRYWSGTIATDSDTFTYTGGAGNWVYLWV